MFHGIQIQQAVQGVDRDCQIRIFGNTADVPREYGVNRLNEQRPRRALYSILVKAKIADRLQLGKEILHVFRHVGAANGEIVAQHHVGKAVANEVGLLLEPRAFRKGTLHHVDQLAIPRRELSVKLLCQTGGQLLHFPVGQLLVGIGLQRGKMHPTAVLIQNVKAGTAKSRPCLTPLAGHIQRDRLAKG